MDYVLVHGTTQSPAGWDRLIHALERRGHRAVAVDLPTGKSDLLAADYAHIVATQAKFDRPVVVAHSGAGLLVPAIAAALDARHVAWLAAAIPDLAGDRSFRDEIKTSVDEMFNPEWSSLTEPPTGDPAVATYFLFHDCDLATLRWGLSTLRLFYPAGVYGENLTGTLPPSTYVLPVEDRTLRPEWMRKTARERLGVEPVEIGGGHCPHVSHAEEVAAILDLIQ